MAYNRQYQSEIGWENFPSTATPLSAGNLRQMDGALVAIDTTVEAAINSLETTKANQSDANQLIQNVEFNPITGVFTFTKLNGQTIPIDTGLEKVVTNWRYDSSTQELVLTLEDGNTQRIDLSALIQNNEFVDSDTIVWIIQNNTVIANVPNGSITGAKLQPNYLADVTTQANNAAGSATIAQQYAVLAESYTHGDTGTRTGENTDNALYFKEKAREYAAEAQGSTGLHDFEPATDSHAGAHGLVPAPPIKVTTHKILGEDGWENAPSFNERFGAVVPMSNDYSASEIGYVNSYVSDYLKEYKDVSISASADTSLSGYTYSQTVAWVGLAETDEINPVIISGGYDGNIAAEVSANSVKIYYQDNPGGGTVRIYRIAAIASHGGVAETTYFEAESLIAMAVNDGDYANEVITINSGKATYSNEVITFE